MTDFDEYLIQGEPSRSEKAKAWKTAIGLQQIDGLVPSEYLIENAKLNIEDQITFSELRERLETYYIKQPKKSDKDRTEEADKVSMRIAEILGKRTFTFSHIEFLDIHRRLFEGIYEHAGKIRTYNIIKKEWVLNGDTVLYGTSESLQATLEYDFQQEKRVNYGRLSNEKIIQHVTNFTSFLWQLHVFGEGNTRTVAVFLINDFFRAPNKLLIINTQYPKSSSSKLKYERSNVRNGTEMVFFIMLITSLGKRGGLELRMKKSTKFGVQFFVESSVVKIPTCLQLRTAIANA